MTDILKERQPSPQNLGRAACKLWGREGTPIIWPISKQMTIQKLPTIIISKERLLSPQKLGRAACKLWEREGTPIIWPISKQMTVQRWPTIIIWITTDISKERLPSPQNLGRAACKLWVRGKPIIWPISKTINNTEITYNNNLDKWPTFWKRDYLHFRNLGAPRVNSEGEGGPIINLAYFKRETTITSESWVRRL